MSGTLVAGVALALATGAAWGASPPSNTTGSAGFQACLKAHGVTLGKTTDQKKIRAAFVACRGSNPSGGGFAQRRLTAAQRAALTKYTTCLTKHGVKIRFGFRPNGQRPPNAPAAGQRPTRPRTIPPKVLAAQKACASVRPSFFRFGRRAPSATNGA